MKNQEKNLLDIARETSSYLRTIRKLRTILEHTREASNAYQEYKDIIEFKTSPKRRKT